MVRVYHTTNAAERTSKRNGGRAKMVAIDTDRGRDAAHSFGGGGARYGQSRGARWADRVGVRRRWRRGGARGGGGGVLAICG